MDRRADRPGTGWLRRHRGGDSRRPSAPASPRGPVLRPRHPLRIAAALLVGDRLAARHPGDASAPRFQASIDWVIGTDRRRDLWQRSSAADPARRRRSRRRWRSPSGSRRWRFLAAINGRYRIAPITAVVALIVPRGPDVGAGTASPSTAPPRSESARWSRCWWRSSSFRRGRMALLAEAASRVLRAVADLLPKLVATRRPGERRRAARRLRRPPGEDRRPRCRGRGGAARAADPAHRGPRPGSAGLLGDRASETTPSSIFRATSAPLPAPIGERLGPPIGRVAEAAAGYIRDLAAAFEMRGLPPPLDAVDAAIAVYSAEVDKRSAPTAPRGRSRPTPSSGCSRSASPSINSGGIWLSSRSTARPSPVLW